jgi:L-methionine (R)-S-oxide reductase
MIDRELAEDLRRSLALDADRATRAARIAASIRQQGAYRWVGIYDVDGARGLVTNLAWSGPAAPAYPTFPITQGLTARAIRERRTVNVGDVASDPAYLTALASTRAEMIVPVFLDRDGKAGAVVGTIDVESEHLDAFDAKVEALLEACARLLRPLWDTAV